MIETHAGGVKQTYTEMLPLRKRHACVRRGYRQVAVASPSFTIDPEVNGVVDHSYRRG